MGARSATEVQVYPVVETTQKDNICHTVVAPAQLPASTVASARDMAERAITSFEGHGIFGIEMFLLKVRCLASSVPLDPSLRPYIRLIQGWARLAKRNCPPPTQLWALYHGSVPGRPVREPPSRYPWAATRQG